MIRRINLFGGPGSGKSTIAAKIFVAAKLRGQSIEHVQEYVKAWTYYDRKPNKWDQVYLFGKQQQAEYRYLANNPNGIIVTDSPIMQGICYTGDRTIAYSLFNLANKYEEEFPSVNIFISRGEKQFQQEGRWQTYDEAKNLDTKIYDFLQQSKLNVQHINFADFVKLNNEDTWYSLMPLIFT